MPQESAVDCYLKVRLGAGTLHVAKYLIHIRDLFLTAKVATFLITAKIGYRIRKEAVGWVSPRRRVRDSGDSRIKRSP